MTDMQSHKLGETIFDEDDIFCPPSFDEQITMMIACLVPMMIILMKVGSEECQI